MSTRSFICVEQDDGSYKGVYCHSDGYLTYNGAMLLDHYNSREKADALIALGDLSRCSAKNSIPIPTSRTVSITTNASRTLPLRMHATVAKNCMKHERLRLKARSIRGVNICTFSAKTANGDTTIMCE